MLGKRYGGNFEVYLELDIDEFMELIKMIGEEEVEMLLYEKWLTLFPFMNMGFIEPIDFKEFKEVSLSPKRSEDRDDDMVRKLELAKAIRKSDRLRVERKEVTEGVK